jgi:competence protein ComEA
MDRLPEWRAVEPAAADQQVSRPIPAAESEATRWRLVALVASAVAVLAGGALAASMAGPSAGVALPPVGETPPALVEPSQAPFAELEIVVDVAGAVERPGLYRLAAGSRLGEAIAIAGGYSVAVDLDLAARRLNLAERLADGAKVHVPRRGEEPAPTAAPSSPTTPTGGTGGLIDVNSADQRQLETLPGIGPVTAGKIIAAREEAPFGSVDELLARKVVGASTFEKIRELISVSP